MNQQMRIESDLWTRKILPGWTVLETIGSSIFIIRNDDTPVILSISLQDPDRYTISPFWPSAKDRRNFIGDGMLWTVRYARARSPWQLQKQVGDYLARLNPAYEQAVAQRDDYERLMDLRTQRMEEILAVVGHRKSRRNLHSHRVKARGIYAVEVNEQGNVTFRTDVLEFGFALEIIKQITREHHDSMLHGISSPDDPETEDGEDSGEEESEG